MIDEKPIVLMVVDDRVEMASIPSSSIVLSIFVVHNNDYIEWNDGLSSYYELAFRQK